MGSGQVVLGQATLFAAAGALAEQVSREEEAVQHQEVGLTTSTTTITFKDRLRRQEVRCGRWALPAWLR